MKKPTALRMHLIAAMPHLDRDPDKLLMFVDEGRILGTGTGTRSYEYQYTLNLILTNFGGNPDAVMVAVVDWLATNQPEQLDNNERRRDAIQFEADILSDDLVDLSIKLPLTERVIARQVEGRWETKAIDEPPSVETDWLTNFERRAAGG
ncbi:phage tail protein [Jeongeupia naejangsanensis]|uniref:Phage tail protein n=1 Tax=Jeongeupia naejangsanensis TaxID=613195 RepID=A0ABS2BH66_9NEIS|nr:phage tail protein [Jeongeupia naejangsanensis]MBM3114959.1 phage tail protein [Jeongeupia naejangsanensis]